MKSTRTNQTQLRTLFFGMLCLLAGVMCVAKGFSHNSANLPAALNETSGERQGVSPPSATLVDAGNPQFTSLTARYVTKRIADLEVGEEVVAKDPESGEVTTKRVANVFRKVSDHLRILQVRNPLTNELQTIETTDDHPFWVTALGQWIYAKDLKLGDRLDDVDGGTAILESTSRELHPEGIPVFNFEVEDFHTYFVRAHGSRGPPVLTHNTDCGPDGFVALNAVEDAARHGTSALSRNSFGAFVPPDGPSPTGTDFSGVVWRYERPDRLATTWSVHSGNIAADHRYSGSGYGAVYAGLTKATARREIAAHVGDIGSRVATQKSVRVTNVLDLRSERIQQQLGVSLKDLTGESYGFTQGIGNWARASGYRGINAPSARFPERANLIVFEGL